MIVRKSLTQRLADGVRSAEKNPIVGVHRHASVPFEFFRHCAKRQDFPSETRGIEKMEFDPFASLHPQHRGECSPRHQFLYDFPRSIPALAGGLNLLERRLAESLATVMIPRDERVLFVCLLDCPQLSGRLSEVAQTLNTISGTQFFAGCCGFGETWSLSTV